MDGMIEKLGMGWLPDYPDFRDNTIENDRVSPKLKQLGQKDSVKIGPFSYASFTLLKHLR